MQRLLDATEDTIDTLAESVYQFDYDQIADSSSEDLETDNLPTDEELFNYYIEQLKVYLLGTVIRLNGLRPGAFFRKWRR